MDNLFQMWWPVACVVLADVIYQVCAKKISSRADPLAALGGDLSCKRRGLHRSLLWDGRNGSA